MQEYNELEEKYFKLLRKKQDVDDKYQDIQLELTEYEVQNREYHAKIAELYYEISELKEKINSLQNRLVSEEDKVLFFKNDNDELRNDMEKLRVHSVKVPMQKLENHGNTFEVVTIALPMMEKISYQLQNDYANFAMRHHIMMKMKDGSVARFSNAQIVELDPISFDVAYQQLCDGLREELIKKMSYSRDMFKRGTFS